jgi:hypothetical protein
VPGDDERRVIFKAIADFTNLAAEAAKARAELRALKEEESQLNSSSLRSSSAANAAKAQGIEETKKSTESTKQHISAVVADAKATEDQAKAHTAVADADKRHASIRTATVNGQTPLAVTELVKALALKQADVKATKELALANDAVTGSVRRSLGLRVPVGVSGRKAPGSGSASVPVPTSSSAPAVVDIQASLDEARRLSKQPTLKEAVSGPSPVVKASEDAEKASVKLTAARMKEKAATESVVAGESKLGNALSVSGKDSKEYEVALSSLSQAYRAQLSAHRDVLVATSAAESAQKKLRSAIKDTANDSKTSVSATKELGTAWKSVKSSFEDVFSALRSGWKDVQAGEGFIKRLSSAVQSAASSATSSSASGGSGLLGNLVGSVPAAAGVVQGFIVKLAPLALGILAVVSAIGPFVSLLGALGAGAIGAGASLGSLAGSTAALPGLFLAAATGIGALLIALQPVMGAFKAYIAQQQAVQQLASDPTAANQQRQNAFAVTTAIWAQQQALQGVSTAVYGQVTAQQTLKSSEYELVTSHQAVASAQNSLNEAVRAATRSLQDLEEEVSKASLDEQGAQLTLQQAELSYRQALANPTATLIQREEALLAVKRAQYGLADAQKTATRNAEDLATAQAKGVMGSDQVVSAQQSLAAALHGVAQAQQAYVSAQHGVLQADQQLVQAQQAVVKSQEALLQAQFTATQGSSKLASANSALNYALSQLSPSALTVVKSFTGMSGAWNNFSNAIQESVFSHLVGQVDNLKSLIPVVTNLFTKAGSAVGEVTAQGIAMVSSGPWRQDFGVLATNNAKIITTLGSASLLVADAFRNITVAAAPFTQWIAAAIERTAKAFDDWSASTRKSGGLADFLKALEPRLSVVKDILKNLFETLGRFGSAALPFGDWLLGQFDKITKGWANAGKAAEQPQSRFKQWLDEMKPILSAMGKTVAIIAGEFAHLAGAPASEHGALDFLNKLNNDWLPKLFAWLDKINASKAFDSVLKAITGLFTAFDAFFKSGGSGLISGFFTTISTALDIITKLNLAPFLGFIAVGLGALAALKFLQFFRLIDALIWLKNNGGVLRDLLAKVGIGSGSQGGDTSGTAAKTDTETAAAEKTGGIWTTAAEKVRAIWVAAAEQMRAIINGGAATAATTTEEGAAVAASTAEKGAVTAAATAEGGATTAAATTEAGATAASGKLAGGMGGVGKALSIALAADIGFEIGQWVGQKLKDVGVIAPTSNVPTTTIGSKTLEAAHDPQAQQRLKNAKLPALPLAAEATPEPDSVWQALSKEFDKDFVKPIQTFFGWVGKSVGDLSKSIGDRVEQFFKGIGDWFTGIDKWLGDTIGHISTAVTNFFKGIGDWFTGIDKWLGDTIGQISKAVLNFFDGIGRFFSDLWNHDISPGLSNLGNAVVGFISSIGNFIGNQLSKLFTNQNPAPSSGVTANTSAFLQSAAGHAYAQSHNLVEWAHAQGIPGYASGGLLRDGISMVGEGGIEFLRKQGSKVEIIPASAQGFSSFGSDFGVQHAHMPALSSSSSRVSWTKNDSSVTSGGIKVEKIEINNPKPELAGDSLFRALQKTQFYAKEGGVQ